MLSKVNFYESLVVKENGKLVITNDYLARFVGKLWRKYSFKFDSYDEFMGSVGYLIWMQIERSDFDFDNMDDKTENQLYKSITKMLTFQVYEDANKDTKRVNGDFVTIDFVSLDAEFENDNTLSEMIEDSFFGSKGSTVKTPFIEWLDENEEKILNANQFKVWRGLRSCLDNSKEEVESKTGLPHKDVSRRQKLIGRKLNQAWGTRTFESTYIYKSIQSELTDLENLLSLDTDEEYFGIIRLAVEDNTKLGNLISDNLTFNELIELNNGIMNKKTMYKVINITIKRTEKLNTFIEDEKTKWENNMNTEIISNTRNKKEKTGHLKLNTFGIQS